MTQQPQAVRPNEAEQTATSSTTAEPQPQAASSMAAEQTETTAVPAEQQPQAASSAVAEQTATSSAATAEQQLQVASSMAAEQVETTAATAEQQPQAAPGSKAEQTSTSPTTEGTCHKDEPLPWYFKFAFAFVIGLWLALLYLGISSTAFDFKCLTKLGTFGDSFGVLNTLFSGLAFLAIIISIKYQRDDLKLQREELAMQRKEITFQRKAIEIQAQEAQHQSEEMESQRRLAQEYQDERFFILLLDQIKGKSTVKSQQEISKNINNCFTTYSYGIPSTLDDEYKKKIHTAIISRYTNTYYHIDKTNTILIFVRFSRLITVKCSSLKPIIDTVVHIHEFIMSLSDEKTRINYARIAYNNIGQYDRIIVFMYLVANLKLRKGDFLGDLLFTDYKKFRAASNPTASFAT